MLSCSYILTYRGILGWLSAQKEKTNLLRKIFVLSVLPVVLLFSHFRYSKKRNV